jgi:hypothetical protein
VSIPQYSRIPDRTPLYCRWSATEFRRPSTDRTWIGGRSDACQSDATRPRGGVSLSPMGLGLRQFSVNIWQSRPHGFAGVPDTRANRDVTSPRERARGNRLRSGRARRQPAKGSGAVVSSVMRRKKARRQLSRRLPADECLGQQYSVIAEFCADLSLCPRTAPTPSGDGRSSSES